MRLRTVKRRLQLSMLPDEGIRCIYHSMKGISDESTKIGCKNNDKWVNVLHDVFKKFTVCP